jgi:hypothetical protein
LTSLKTKNARRDATCAGGHRFVRSVADDQGSIERTPPARQARFSRFRKAVSMNIAQQYKREGG